MERAIIANRKHDKGEVRKEMSERKMKRVEDSLTEQSHLLMPKCLNAAGICLADSCLHGLMKQQVLLPNVMRK